MSLHEAYKALPKSVWCYYEDDQGKLSQWNDKEINKMSNLETKAKEFIVNYFKVGGKGTAIESPSVDGLLDSLDDDRLKHMVSTFFLGILIYDKSNLIKQSIDNSLDLVRDKMKEKSSNSIKFIEEVLEKQQPEKTFAYHWFLICLYHDIGTEVESGNFYNLEIEKLCNELREEIRTPQGSFIPIPEILMKTSEKYACYRRSAFDGVREDHGFIAGNLLYKQMSKLHSSDQVTKKENGLWSGKPILETEIAHCAWVIATHNMWLLRKGKDKIEDLQKYNNYGLSGLILLENDPPKITFEDHPLLFLFCLVDTIEPVKRGGWDALKKTTVEFDDNTIVIKNHPTGTLGLDFIIPEVTSEIRIPLSK